MACTLPAKKMARPAQDMPTKPGVCWSSLVPDLVRRIAACFLAADDLDYCMDFRAACHGWRAATDSPTSCAFQPSKWALLHRHDDLAARDVVLTLANVATGRFLRKSIPVLRGYFFVGATSGGLLLLGEPAHPYQARVLNPFTGAVARFKAPVPVSRAREVAVTTTSSSLSPPVMTVFISSGLDDGEATIIMWADQNSEYFHRFSAPYPADPLCMVPFAGNLYLTNRQGSILSMAAADEQGRRSGSARTLSMATIIPAAGLGLEPVKDNGRAYYLVESGGELLLVTRSCYGTPQQLLAIHRVDIANKVLEPVRSIGGRTRCLSVDAGKLQGIEGGCVYFVDQIVTGGGYFDCSFVNGFRVADDGAQQHMMYLSTGEGCFRPLTLTQVLARYCIQSEPRQIMIYDDEEEDFSDDDDYYESDDGGSSSESNE